MEHSRRKVGYGSQGKLDWRDINDRAKWQSKAFGDGLGNEVRSSTRRRFSGVTLIAGRDDLGEEEA
jgi:hypothetical protein